MSERAPRLVPGELTDDQRVVYESIAGGERAKGTQHFPLAADDGSLHGPFGLMLLAPSVGSVLAELGATLRFHTDLSARTREIVILQVAQATGSEFEWWAHARVAKAIGFTDEELMGLAIGAFASPDSFEQAVAELAANLLTSSVVTDAEFERVSTVLDAGQIVEVTVLVGYYRTLAQLMNVFAIGVPEGEAPAVVADDHHHHSH